MSRFLICLVLRELGDYSSADLYFRIDEVLTNGTSALSSCGIGAETNYICYSLELCQK